MARTARIVVPDFPYHITQRGNNKQITFKDDHDYKKYLYWLDEYAQKFGLDILAYCLMPNHVHFIAIPKHENALAKIFQITHMRYAQYFNARNNAVGHLWQGRFYSTRLNDTHLLMALRYVERNPVRSGLVNNPIEWPWSSASFHYTKSHSIIKLADFEEKFDKDFWAEYIQEKDNPSDLRDLRKGTHAH